MPTDLNPYKAPNELETVPPHSPAAKEEVPATMWSDVKRNAVFAVRWTTWIIGPVLLLLLFALAAMAIFSVYKQVPQAKAPDFWPMFAVAPFMLLGAYALALFYAVAFASAAGAVGYWFTKLRDRSKPID